MQVSVVLQEPESQFVSIGASRAMAAQCRVVIRNRGSHVGDVVDTWRCAGVRCRRSEVCREIGEKCGILSQLDWCDEIGVRLTVIRHSDRARYEPTVVAWYALVPLAGGRILLGAHSRVPSREVLRCWKGG